MAEIAHHSLNPDGRDFVVGDIHGMYTSLEALLAQVAFDPRVDRLFSVGDLIDRGPESPLSLDWLAKPWFHCVRGNHDQFVLAAKTRMEIALWAGNNGGEWWLTRPEAEQQRFREAVSAMPYGMDIQTATETVAVVHADIPYGMSWPKFQKAVLKDDAKALETAIWSRKRIRDVVAGRPVPAVKGCDVLIAGHTPVSAIVDDGQFVYLDTGAVYTSEPWAALTLYQIHPERGEFWRLETAELPDDQTDPGLPFG